MLVRFWDSQFSKVIEIQCLCFEFLEHAAVEEMLVHFKNGIAILNFNCLL